MTPQEFKLMVDREYAVIQARRAADARQSETRGKARQRLLKVAMAGLKRGNDQEDMIRMIMGDAIAERLEPAEDDRYYWARGIVNFCESALGMRDRH